MRGRWAPSCFRYATDPSAVLKSHSDLGPLTAACTCTGPLHALPPTPVPPMETVFLSVSLSVF